MAHGECDRCGFRRPHNTLRKEWTGLMVCTTGPESCFDPRPPWLDPPVIDPLEGMPLPDARFQKTPIYTDDDNPVTADDL